MNSVTVDKVNKMSELKQKNFEAEVKVKFEITGETIESIMLTADIGYWCTGDIKEVEEDGFKTHHLVIKEDEEDSKEITVNGSMIAFALQEIISCNTQVNEGIRESIYLATIGNNGDNGHYYDAEDCDVIIQVAALKEIVYG